MKTSENETRSKTMARVRSKGNKSTELKFITILKSHSILGWRCQPNMFGKPDFVFPRKRVVVFIDGCFWHGCSKHCRKPTANAKYWNTKINGNLIRDRDVNKELKKLGWHVIRIWEHELKGCASLSRKLNSLND